MRQMKRMALAMAALAVFSATLNVCWMPASLCQPTERAEPSCHHEEGVPADSGCCRGSHAEMTEAAVAQAPVLEAVFFVVSLLQSPELADASTSSWSLSDPDVSPPSRLPSAPDLGRAPPVLA